jgi:chromate transporter
MIVAARPGGVTIAELVRYFLGLGATGFGGPAALVAFMKDDLVERRGWLTGEQYLEGLAICQTLPGPLAIQVGIYVGYVCRGVAGAWAAGTAFILPPFLIVLGCAYVYVRFETLTIVQALFYGVSPVVIALIVHSSYSLGKIALNDRFLWIIGVIVAVVTASFEAEIAVLFVAAGLAGIAMYARPRSTSAAMALSTVAASGAGSLAHRSLTSLFTFFVKAGSLTFGSGLVIVPFLRQGLVAQQHWLGERDFIVAVAIGMMSPGPVVITATFVGYLVAGWLGSVVATVGMFLPSFLFVTLVAPVLVRHRSNLYLRGFVKGVSAAAVGAIFGAGVILGRLAIGDVFTAIVGVAAAIALFWWHVPAPKLVAMAAAAGLAAFSWLRPTWLLVR